MPRCNLSQEFLIYILQNRPAKTLHYTDKELNGFLLEYRSSGAGTWYFRYTHAQKKTRYFRMGTTRDMNATSAREQAYRIQALVRNGEDPHQLLSIPTNRLTVKDFALERYLPHIQLKKRSWYLDKRVLEKYVFPVFGECFLDTIRRIDLVAWQNTLPEQGLAANSSNRILSVIKGLFNCAVRWGVLDSLRNPCMYMTRFPENTPRTQYLDKEEARKVLALLQTMKNAGAKALQLLLFTGARKSEITNARWEYIHIEERILTIPLSKSGKARHIPLSDEALKIINSLSRKSKSPWLFPSADPTKPISSLYHTWDKVRKATGLENVRIHDLRHSFASLLVNAGCSLYEVQKILGHHDPKVTMRYAHFAQASLVDAANRVGESVYYDEGKVSSKQTIKK